MDTKLQTRPFSKGSVGATGTEKKVSFLMLPLHIVSLYISVCALWSLFLVIKIMVTPGAAFEKKKKMSTCTQFNNNFEEETMHMLHVTLLSG